MRTASGAALLLAAGAAAGAIWWLARDTPSAQGAAASSAAAPDAAPAPALGPPARTEAAEPAAPSVAQREASTPDLATVLPVVSEEPRAAGALRATVRRASGEPASGVGVLAWSEERATPHAFPAVATTDAKGIAHFQRLPVGPTALRGDRSGEARADIAEGRTAEVELALLPGHLVRGRTVDAAGRIVSHADVWLHAGVEDHAGARVATSDNSGRFELADVPGGAWLLARASGKSPSPPRQVTAPGAGSAIELDLSLGESGSHLLGQVVDESESPVAGAAVCVLPRRAAASGRQPEPWISCLTDGEGRFDLNGLGYGRARLVALFPGLAPLEEEIELLPESRDERVLRLSRGGAVGGRIRSADGTPAADVAVRLGGADEFLRFEARTHDDGSFLLRGLPPGVHELDLGGQRVAVEVVAGDLTSISPRLNP